ncbi:SpoIIE family protein phosphatase [Streptomyces tanashiensis]|uniref:SpoIIE family protein phosphatase n=1 Tax=Streptomyces tanashiensis TaxID=67367 RepID=UPI0033C9D269
MNGPGIDYEAVFQALPGAVAPLTPGLVYADADETFLSMSGRTREQVVGRYLFDVLPGNPEDPTASGTHNLRASLERVVATGERDSMALQRYDVESPDRPGVWQEPYWSPVNVPLLAPDGTAALPLHRVEEVTELMRARGARAGDDRARVLEAFCHPDGRVEFLDRATDPPLGARPEHVPRPQAETAFTDGAVPALYTDGLVERRREDIDTGLNRLADALARNRTAAPEALADILLTELTPPVGNTDDTALVLIHL